MADDDMDKLLNGIEPARSPGVTGRVRAGVPRAVVVGAGCGVVVGGLFSVLPFVDGVSGALAAFGTGFFVSLAARVRRRR